MSVSMFSLFGHALLLLISFSGLCAGIRTVLKIHRFIAPYVAACGVIAILMLAGMARILELSFWALYILGFICCIYAYLIKRQRPEFGMIAALCVFFIFLVWRFYFCPLYRNDDISHWGLVARHLLRHDAFPDANAQHIFFQSYPLGAASFIYYIGKTLGNTEGIYLVAQDLLQGLLFLPIFAHICDHRKTYYPIAVAFYLLLFSFFRNMVNLQVDLLLSFFGIGMIAAVSYYRNDIKKAVLTGLIGMIAIVYVKNSGLFFAFITSLLLGYCGHRCKKKGFSIGRLIVVSFAISVIAYSLWMLHIRLSYPAALETKHAVSLSAYAAEASSKSLSVILQIIKSYLKELFSLSFPQFCAYSFILLCVGYLVYGSRTTSPFVRKTYPCRSCSGFCWFASASISCGLFWSSLCTYSPCLRKKPCAPRASTGTTAQASAS